MAYRHALTLLVASGVLFSDASSQDYKALWEKGRVVEALDAIESYIGDEVDDERTQTIRDHASLLFHVGKIDRAIEVAEPLAESYRSLVDRVNLAEYYRYRGRTDDLERILDQSLRISRMMMQYGLDAENWIAAGKLMEMDGSDPAKILTHYKKLLDAQPEHRDGRIAAADIALKTKSYDVAARYYNSALETDSTSQAAQAGIAHAFIASGDPRADIALRNLAELNPHHPDLFLIDADRHLDLGDTKAALQALQTLLEVNPNHLDALARKAAAHFLDDETDSMSATQKRIFSTNPRASQAFRIPGKIATRHYRFRQGKMLQHMALDVDPDDTEARLMLALNQLRLGEDVQARPHLERVFESDPYNVQAYNLLGVSDAIRTFDVIRTETFDLQMPRDEAVVISTRAHALLDSAATRYQSEYDIQLETPVTVQIFDDHDEFIVRSVGLPGMAGHLGICFGKLITMDSPRARPPGSTNWEQVLWHEFVHVITLQKTTNRIQRWLSEGISVYEETRQDESWGVKLDPQYKAIVDESGWPSTQVLERYFTQPESQDELMFGYFAAGEFVSAYVDRFGQGAIVDALDKIGNGLRTAEALALAADTDLADIDKNFKEHMKIRCSALDYVSSHSNAYQLDEPILSLVARGDSLAEQGKREDAEARYLEAHRLYPDYQGQGAPLRRTTKLWEDSESVENRVRVLRNLVAWDAKAYKACLELAEISTDAQLRSWALDRAFAIRPFDLKLLNLRQKHFRSTGSRHRSLEETNRLIHLDPAHVANHKLTRAEILIEEGDTVSAKSTLLSLLEETPHDWPAQSLLLSLVSEITP